MVTVREAVSEDRAQLAKMRHSLWPDSSIDEHTEELKGILGSEKSGTLPGIVLVAEDQNGQLTGFLEAGLRSHADGCDTASPVGFVEGWFVREQRRNQGTGKALLKAAEAWARAQGCLEMASNTQIENLDSQKVHQALGFEIANRCVHFRKSL